MYVVVLLHFFIRISIFSSSINFRFWALVHVIWHLCYLCLWCIHASNCCRGSDPPAPAAWRRPKKGHRRHQANGGPRLGWEPSLSARTGWGVSKGLHYPSHRVRAPRRPPRSKDIKPVGGLVQNEGLSCPLRTVQGVCKGNRRCQSGAPHLATKGAPEGPYPKLPQRGQGAPRGVGSGSGVVPAMQ